MFEDERRKYSNVMMFVSFDLVNCTLYKSKYKGNWANGVSSIIDHILGALNKRPVEGYEFWKVLGDEAVYTKKIHNVLEITEILDDVYDTLIHINKKIKAAEIGDHRTAEILAVKATAWIADISPSHLSADNIVVEYKMSENNVHLEYLGTDIDGGFRIAKYTSENRLVVSADLAALILNEELIRDQFDKINFVGFRHLKGIWDDEAYPIFMYHADKNTTFLQSIKSCENLKNEILEEYLEQVSDRCVKEPYHSYEEQIVTELYRGTRREVDVLQLIGILSMPN